jgi:hypothetical protein
MPFAIISAGASIIGGIFGASQASNANAASRSAQKKQQKLLDKQADLQNEYNKKAKANQIENYRKQANYNFDTAIKSWQYQTTVRALQEKVQEKVDAEKYLLNVKNSNKELTFNALAEQQGLSREQLAQQDARNEYAFNRQDLLVAQLQSQGKASLGQAGRSRSKSIQSDLAQIGRDIAVMDASLTGEIKQSNLNMFDVRLGRHAADARVEAARMLRPERLPDIPAPTKPPEPTWLEPMKILPGMAAPAQQQSVFAPLISGIGSAASSLATIDFNPTKTAQKTLDIPFSAGFGTNFGTPRYYG